MSDNGSLEHLSVEELRDLLYRKKYAQRQERLQRLKASGRVVRVEGIAPPSGPATAVRVFTPPLETGDAVVESNEPLPTRRRVQWGWVFNKLLLLVEVTAVAGLAFMLLNLWATSAELNQELDKAQIAQLQSLALPTPSATPVINVVVLPGGHKPPINGRPPEQGEAGDIPAHLLPAINAYVPPPIPTPSAEQARRIQIPALDIDKTIVQGDDWEQLKKGVGQHIGSAEAGQVGNMVLSAHNDIYGEIFRYLDKLQPGDEIIISTERSSYTYVVREMDIVDPTDVAVMAPTKYASLTLISCYPYHVNNKRYIIFADLATTD